ncbi:low molecular weight protein-tyrosine-phosphatase [Priestia koreensis]|uniref:low molecular weight protein-tyrosine-phosphatase n=1 Tax=Priestia koreensis TaxID=284581 RepID=UPI00203BFDD7|nr:low molecular weight protein-tyrosine-phosphatase [Priestia koreensis]MCM3007010.1 low molecular weight phosphotyrosine protein phosphatase [Priestia koreensis]
MVKVLFVCLGNICRSPMAEAVFRHLVREKGLEDKISIDSAGTGDWHIGTPPHEGTQRILTKKQISFDGLKARQVQKEDLTEFDYIIGMDAQNIGNLHRMAGFNKTGYIGRLLDFVPESEIEDVPDPYFTGNFDEVYELVTKGCTNLLAEIIHEHFSDEIHK